MGRGHYSQRDVTEAARAFTGWTIDGARNNRFTFNPDFHDDGPKVFLGNSGNFTGEDIIAILAARPETATFLAAKLARFFLGGDPSPELTQRLSDIYFAVGGKIRELVREILLSDDFDRTADQPDMFKSPVELIVDARRSMGAVDEPGGYLQWPDLMGMALFRPPDVSGWKGGRSWVHTGAYLIRIAIAFSIVTQPSQGSEFFRWDLGRFFRDTSFASPDELIDFVADQFNLVAVSEPLRLALRQYLATAGDPFVWTPPTRRDLRARRGVPRHVEPGVSTPIGEAMVLDRRTLISRSCMTAAAFAARPKWSAAGIFRDSSQARAAASDTILVVVDMNGGNDGLNTVVPFGARAYGAARPRIALSGSQLLPIDSKTGLHASLSHLHGYLQSGKLAIVQGVGYPGPDMSHFRSDDIWETGVAERVEGSGWVGRALDQLYRQDSEAIHSVAMSGPVPAFNGEYVTTPVITDPGSFNYPRDDPNQVAALRAMFRPAGAANRDYVAHVGEIALADAESVQAAFASYSSTVVYPENTGLATSLKLTASVIFADLGPRVFWVVQGGYDTHSNELGDHGGLLSELDQSLDAFYRDLVEHGQDRRVVVMTYSEFGRRVEDNGSGGTDHGTAGLMFLLGTKVRGGLFGAPPSLTDLDPDGNLKHSTDFRQVYASLLANWIDTDPVPVLFGGYPTIPLV